MIALTNVNKNRSAKCIFGIFVAVSKIYKSINTKTKMKKLFLLLAFTGIVGAASAKSLVTLTKGTIVFLGDDKKGDDKKKDGKSCSDKEKGKEGCKMGAGHSCCKKGGEEKSTGDAKSGDTKTSTAPAKK